MEKKGYNDDPTKYQGITISSTIGKVCEGILITITEDLFKGHQSKLKFGFTPG